MNHKPSQLVSNQSASRARDAPECLIFATFPNNYDAYWLMKSHTDRELWIATNTCLHCDHFTNFHLGQPEICC